MVRSSRADLDRLRDEVLGRDLGCVWLGCQTGAELQVAHLEHRGMGGSRARNTADNCVTLCAVHHDVFDGRTGGGQHRRELSSLLRALAALRVLRGIR